MLSTADRMSYAARQGARVAFYLGHYALARAWRAQSQSPAAQPEPAERPRKALPPLARVLEGLADVFRSDLANAAAGHYPLPADHDGSLADLVSRSRRFFADIPEAAARKRDNRGREVYDPALAESYPAYFLQNFHYQTGGYLTEESAELYDLQVETLFSGSANAMRRHCLVPIAEAMKGRDQRKVKLIDIACGTGRFLRFAAEAFPRMELTGSDLSQAYLEEARRHLAPYGARWQQANAESLPYPDESFDFVTSIYLFHEVPPPVRRVIAREFARLLKPGGRLVFMDSLQTGDTPDLDGLLDAFPRDFHEPFYRSYIAENLSALFAEAGLKVIAERPVFLSKMVVAERA